MKMEKSLTMNASDFFFSPTILSYEIRKGGKAFFVKGAECARRCLDLDELIILRIPDALGLEVRKETRFGAIDRMGNVVSRYRLYAA